jgi:hypothetical protein
MKSHNGSADKVLGESIVAYLKIVPGLHLAELRRTAYKKDYQRQDNKKSDGENCILTSMYVVYMVHW